MRWKLAMVLALSVLLGACGGGGGGGGATATGFGEGEVWPADADLIGHAREAPPSMGAFEA